jgi:putative hydrolase of the HAD superfamily
MTRKMALFFDVGGVVLTNAWDRAARRRAAEHFSLDREDFEGRHELAVSDFETSRIGLEEYLDRTVFCASRPFTRDAFKAFMREQSQADPEALAFVGELAHSQRYLLATLNNESKELNEYRIEQFHLRDYFGLFFSSCYLGMRKPDEKIYRLALEVTQRSPEECLFVDDRAINIEGARRAGIPAIQYRGVAKLREDLRLNQIYETTE